MNRLLQYKNAYSFYKKNKPVSKIIKLLDLIKFLLKKRIVTYYGTTYMDLSKQFENLLYKVNADGLVFDYFYPLDIDTLRCIPPQQKPIASVTVNYERVLNGSLNDIKKRLEGIDNSEFRETLLSTLESVANFIKKVKQSLLLGGNREKEISGYLERLENQPCQGFDEAIQRILFFNALLWQNGHQQNGIGRLDLLLYPYYMKDVQEGRITNKSARLMLSNMIKVLGKDILYKSAELTGDTGQIIILGGIDQNGKNVENEITHMLLEIFRDSPIPDPKLLIRVNQETSQVLWRKSVDCIMTGCGSPLMMNETLIMNGMKAFGYEEKDVWNFGTSACWEPLIIGKSFDQNNRIKNIPVIDSIMSTLNKKSYFKKYSDFESAVLDELRKMLQDWPLIISFDKSPIMTLLFDNCIESGKDFCEGGAKYNFHGLLVLGLPNLINALLNIRKFVFEKQFFTIKEVKGALSENYRNHEDMLQLFRNNTLKFGLDHEEVVALTNLITGVINDEVSKLSILGNKAKVGFSSPGYIGLASECIATPDGRKNGDPFAVHISPISSEIGISEILRFAAKMDYSGPIAHFAG